MAEASSGATSGGEEILARVAALTRAGLFSSWGRSREGRPIVRGSFARGEAVAAAGSPGLPTGAPGSRLLLVGGVHGDEPASVEALLELAERMATLAAVPLTVTMVPVLNPDGLAAGRKNSASDVDLNRNFPARNFVTAHAPGYDPGPAALSEPETALLAQLIEEEGIDAVVAVHAPFACVNYDGPAASWAQVVAEASGWPVRENIGYPTPGSLGSWLGVDRQVPVLTLELPPGPLAEFAAPAAAALDAACSGYLSQVLAARR